MTKVNYIHMETPKIWLKVRNLSSPRGGQVQNQFIIDMTEGQYFQSYDSLIAFRPYGNGTIVLDTKFWNYSRTTSKYRSIFLNETTKETERKIKEGVYILADMNA